MSVSLDTLKPCIFGVLTCLTEEQVVVRSTGEKDHGPGWAGAAVQMGLMSREMRGAVAERSQKEIGVMGF